MKMKRYVAVAMAVATTVALASCTQNNENPKAHTYNTYSTALGSNWNPHTWETSADSAIQGYITSPFVDISIKNSKTQEYQWVYEMATKVEDVTADRKEDLTKYNCNLGSKTLDSIESGYVFEITLNENAKFDDGTKITADDYVKSMELLLNSSMRNYRANTYYSGTSAIAGGKKYFDSEAPIYEPIVPAYEEEGDYSFDMTNNKVYLNVDSNEMRIASYSFADMVDYNIVNADDLTKFGDANAYGYYEYNDNTKEAMYKVMDQYLSGFGASIYTDEAKTQVNMEYVMEFLFYNTGKKGEKFEFSGVGIYKVSDYKFRYVCESYIEKNYFLSSLTSNWLVKTDVYEKLYDTTGELKTTTYCTSKDTSPSYGPYKIESLQDAKQLVLTRNENWYGYERDADGNLVKDEDGNLVSYTNFKVDGKTERQYLTDKIVIDVMTDETAKQKFLKGEIDEWAPTSTELPKYATSTQLYQQDETYTMSFFLDTNVEKLQAMDASKGNKNSVALSNYNFRKAFSLCINRADWVTATAGYKPAYSIMCSLYYYDAFNDPTSIYRSTDEAKQAIVNLYGVEYGADKTYKTLDEAYNSINGYNLTEAKNLMKTAYEELTAKGLLNGTEIKIKIAYKKGALDSDDLKQVRLIEEYLNAAIDGSGFTKVTLEAVGNLADRYGAVSKEGEYAIGYGAWGGAAFYPFGIFQVYMDPDQNSLQEAACWNPKVETLTININGEDVTMTYQDWSNSMEGTGAYAEADFATKLHITATLEEEFLKKYYRIPLASETACFLISYKLAYFTDNYNIMYSFGGFRLLQYNYNNGEWANYVKENSVNGEVKY